MPCSHDDAGLWHAWALSWICEKNHKNNYIKKICCNPQYFFKKNYKAVTISNCKLKIYDIYSQLQIFFLYIYIYTIFLKFRQSFLCILQIPSYRLNHFSTCNINHNIHPIIWTSKNSSIFQYLNSIFLQNTIIKLINS